MFACLLVSKLVVFIIVKKLKNKKGLEEFMVAYAQDRMSGRPLRVLAESLLAGKWCQINSMFKKIHIYSVGPFPSSQYILSMTCSREWETQDECSAVLISKHLPLDSSLQLFVCVLWFLYTMLLYTARKPLENLSKMVGDLFQALLAFRAPAILNRVLLAPTGTSLSLGR